MSIMSKKSSLLHHCFLQDVFETHLGFKLRNDLSYSTQTLSTTLKTLNCGQLIT